MANREQNTQEILWSWPLRIESAGEDLDVFLERFRGQGTKGEAEEVA
jgi:hypothetical protein